MLKQDCVRKQSFISKDSWKIGTDPQTFEIEFKRLIKSIKWISCQSISRCNPIQGSIDPVRAFQGGTETYFRNVFFLVELHRSERLEKLHWR